MSVTLNGDLYVKVEAHGMDDASQVAETALEGALALCLTRKAQAEIEQDPAVYNAYVEKQGPPAEMLRTISQIAAMQLEVFEAPLVRARRAYPYVVVLQSDISATGREWVMALLVGRK